MFLRPNMYEALQTDYGLETTASLNYMLFKQVLMSAYRDTEPPTMYDLMDGWNDWTLHFYVMKDLKFTREECQAMREKRWVDVADLANDGEWEEYQFY